MRGPHYNWVSGQPCNCGFGRLPGPDELDAERAMILAAEEKKKPPGKLHGFLMNPKSRPDLQDEEGQQFLKHLEDHYHNETTDPLMPWLTREWKKGRLQYSGLNPSDPSLKFDPAWNQNAENPIPGRTTTLNPGTVRHWADWYHSKAPNRQGVDLMKLQLPDMQQKIDEWQEWMDEKARQTQAAESAKNTPIAHQFDDGWTVRQLRPEDLEYEGDAMGHCVGGYGYDQHIKDGNSMIYSLRDPDQKPHVTMELTPKQFSHYNFDLEHALEHDPTARHLPDWTKDQVRDIHNQKENGTYPGGNESDALYQALSGKYSTPVPVPNRGIIEQIQGKSDKEPIPEYQQRMKQWFQTFPEEERPNWEYDQSPMRHIEQITDPGNNDYDNEDRLGGDGTGYVPHGDYGLKEPPRSIDYPSVLDSLLSESRHNYGYGLSYSNSDVEALYREALKRRQIPDLGKATEEFGDKQQSSFDDWRDMNWEHQENRYPDDNADEFQNEDGSFNQEAYEEAEKEHYAEEERWSEEHAGMMASKDLYGLLAPHQDQTGRYGYSNEIPGVDLTGFQPNTEGTKVRDLPVGAQFTSLDGQPVTVTGMNRNGFPEVDGSGYNSMHEPTHIMMPDGQQKTGSYTGMKPTYYRWVYSPANDEVDLGHNWEDHPSAIDYHGGMAANRNEPGLVHGYGYRLKGGWRLTDWDHRPVADPHVVSQVVHALRGREGVTQAPMSAEEPTWQDSGGMDWDRQHNSLPLPIDNG